MSIIFKSALIIFAISIILLTYCFFRFRSIFDKILSVSAINNIIIILLLAIGITPATNFFIDIAIIYVLSSIIALFAILKYFYDLSRNK